MQNSTFSFWSKCSIGLIALTCSSLFYSQSGFADSGSNTDKPRSKSNAHLSSTPSIAGAPLALMVPKKGSAEADPNAVDPDSDGMTQYYKPYNPNVDVTPSARGCTQSSGPFLTGSFIYWRSKFDVNNVVIDANSLTYNTTVVGKIKANLDSPSTRYSPGFKLGVGYNIKRDVWDTCFNWTWLQSNISSSYSSSNFSLIPLIASDFIGDLRITAANSLKAHWKIHFNSLDWELGRNFFIGRNLSLRPLVGLKGAWINTDLKARTSEVGIGGVDFQNVAADTSTKLTNHNAGIGPRFGINTRWVLTHYNFGFVANVAGSLLWEHVNTKFDQDILPTPGVTPANPSYTGIIAKTYQNLLVPVVETYLGLDWGRCFGKKNYYVYATAGFEMQYWANQQQFGPFLDTNPSNDLNLYGLTLSGRFDF